MAKREHVDILRQGVDVWNKWRKEHALENSMVDLSGADLDHLDLRGANLDVAQITESSLIGTDLRGADLWLADLSLSDLTGANLSASSLIKTIFVRTTLTGAIFRNTSLHLTVFSDVDLSKCKFLETCIHTGPSSIDLMTLRQSGNLPPIFLRGAGLSDSLIDYIPTLFLTAIQFYSCFISYSARNETFARKLYSDLQNAGVRCWFAPEDMKIGSKILDAITDAVRMRDKVLLILSKEAIDSGWVEDEVTKAFAEERQRNATVLFPIRIDDAVFTSDEAWAIKLRDSRNIGDFRRWRAASAYRRALDQLLRDLRASDPLPVQNS